MRVITKGVHNEGFGAIISANTPQLYADYTCDGAADEETINTAINKVYDDYGGGEVKLMPGTYNLTAPIQLKSKIQLLGSGSQSTIINQTSTTDEAINNEGCGGSGIRDLMIILPGDSANDGIKSGTGGDTINNIEFRGGSGASWMITNDQGMYFHYSKLSESIGGDWDGNGLQFINTHETIHTGNALVESVNIKLRSNNTKALKIYGGTKLVNLTKFSNINILKKGAITGTVGVEIYKSNYCTFDMLDIEDVDIGVNILYGDNHTFTGVYIGGNSTASIYQSNSAKYNTFVGGYVVGDIVDEQTNETKDLNLYGGNYG